ncbi:Tetratricopeptide repeat-containing protein [Mucilaginibacter sp. OK098]|nr:Tetratricopeptide repeat-containing protein [Mucilaginibacter sp. OK098]
MVIIIAGCSLEKKSGFNRTMQNLTAHYNILFNAKEILRLKQVSYESSFVDNYNEILSVYPDTITQSGTPDKDLEEAIVKGNKIINIKEQSHYQGDAYLVLGKANFLEGNYFNATEFLNYVIKSFPARLDLEQDALIWKARSLMYLNELPQAKIAIDSAIQIIDPKKNKHLIADIYATKLQYDINAQEYADGEEMAKQAISHCSNKMQRLRWTFILSQLQELNQKPADAITNYSKIASSNVSFEMAFNASLNRIRIEDARNGVKTSRTERLLALLKEPNNKEFKDQIYFQVAELQMVDKNIDGAIKNYKLSVRNSVKNQSQKGLSYLRLATIYFKNKADYLTSKKYYDSTLTTLPVNYPGYQSIKKTNANLQILADGYQTIAREDTLQALAKMDEKTRGTVIDKMVSDKTLQQQADLNAANAAAAAANNVTDPSGPRSGRANAANTFYFYNSNAVSQGYGDFKRKWGDRKLEDNWRRSSRSNSDITANSVNTTGIDPDAPISGQPGAKPKTATAGGYRAELIQGLPLTPELLAQSNLKIYHAYIDIANFYRDILGDKKEAIAIYENILRRFPNDPNKVSIYYNLYRLYSDVDKSKSDQYKNILLKEYADTPFAKIISDPDYAKKLEDENAEFTQAYNRVFDLYAQKKYPDVITGVPQLVKQYPGNKLSAQLYYLKTIAEGHNEKLAPFTDSLQQITKTFPDDKLVTPLINRQLAYINTNLTELQARPVILTDDNPQEIPFTLDQALHEETAYRPVVDPNAINQPQVRIERQQQIAIEKPKQAPPKIAPTILTPIKQPAVITKQVQQITPPVEQAVQQNIVITPTTNNQEVKADVITSVFTMHDSTNYYFAVNVKSGTTNLASSRFGFGQFIRANYSGKGIKHQLLPVGTDNQVIYVGRFSTLADAKKYAREVIPLLPDIMKVPKDKYSFFIISQENLNKLADAKLLDSYLDYYQKNF